MVFVTHSFVQTNLRLASEKPRTLQHCQYCYKQEPSWKLDGSSRFTPIARRAEIWYAMLSQIEKGLQSRVSGNPYTYS